MIILVLAVLGLCLGSFVNALVWRVHEQTELGKKRGSAAALYRSQLSIARGRSMCPACHHELAARDLVPVFSWLWLRGKCRYCGKPISWQYPLVESGNAILFIVSYLWWPYVFHGLGLYYFIFWLVFLTGFTALAVYDLRWQLLPNRLIFPLIGLAVVEVLGAFLFYDIGWRGLAGAVWGIIVSAGFFYVIFQISGGEWIGGGDVKLGIVIGLIIGGPIRSLLMLFFASLLGTIAGLPLLLAGKRQVRIPFGPFLLAATVIVMLFGVSIISWYKTQFLP